MSLPGAFGSGAALGAGGRAYNESGNPDYAACNEGEDGWGDVQSWASSSWSAGALGSEASVGAGGASPRRAAGR